MNFCRRLYRLAVVGLLLTACAGHPPADWQVNAKDGLNDAVEAYLAGNDRLAARQFLRGKSEVARTGRLSLAARVELLHCAVRVASLDFDDCPAYQALARDAAPAEQAYARYLAGLAQPADWPLLPPAARATSASAAPETELLAVEDPLAQLLAAAVLLRRGEGNDRIIATAVDGAAAQGWRRPLLAWLHVQQQRALARGAADEVTQVQRRIELVSRRMPR